MSNYDEKVIEDFGDEWTKFSYEYLDELELKENFEQYFDVFPWDLLPKDAVGFDMGCGTGRWAKFVAPKVKILNCIDPSNAIIVANWLLKDNCLAYPNFEEFINN